MSKILIITYPEAAIGFRMAGVDVIELDKDEEFSEVLGEILKEEVYGLMAVEESFLSHLNEGIRRRLAKRGKPIIVPISTPMMWARKEEAETYVARLIRRAIGYQIKIKR